MPTLSLERRLSRLVAGWSRIHRAQQRAGGEAVARFWRNQTPKIVSRLRRSTAGRMFPESHELIEPTDFRDTFNRLWRPRWNELAWRGIELEQAWITRAVESASELQRLMRGWQVTQSANPEELPEPPPSILVEVSDQTRRALKEWLEERAVGVWQSVADTTRKRLTDAIQEGIVGGDDLDDMVARVRRTLSDYSDQQARVLVRTETTGGMNRGQQLARFDAGVELKRWVTTLDVRTRTVANSGRFDHLAANRQTVPNNGLFVVSGQKLLHPGDTSNGASAGNVVQCRCVAVAHFDDDE